MEAEERQEREAGFPVQESRSARSHDQPHSPLSANSVLDPSGPAPWSPGPQDDPPQQHQWPPSSYPSSSHFIWPPANSLPQPLFDSATLPPSTLQVDPWSHSPSQLVQAMNSDVAFIEGDPSRQEGLELYYYRFVSLVSAFLVFEHG